MQAGNSLLQSSFPLMRGLYTEKEPWTKWKLFPKHVPTQINACLINMCLLFLFVSLMFYWFYTQTMLNDGNDCFQQIQCIKCDFEKYTGMVYPNDVYYNKI